MMVRALCVLLGLLLWTAPVQATVDWDEGFEYADDTAMFAVWGSSCGAGRSEERRVGKECRL